MEFVSWLNYAGVATFAASSALVSRRHDLDVTATVLLSCIAALGGGTLRDVLIRQPVFWVVDPNFIIGCTIASAAIWCLRTGDRTAEIVTLFEAIGIGCLAVFGVAKTADSGNGTVVAVVMGVLTILASKTIYVTASLLSAAAYAFALSLGVSSSASAFVGATSGIILRLGAIRCGWVMPANR